MSRINNITNFKLTKTASLTAFSQFCFIFLFDVDHFILSSSVESKREGADTTFSANASASQIHKYYLMGKEWVRFAFRYPFDRTRVKHCR